MSLSIKMRFDEAAALFQRVNVATDETVTLNFDNNSQIAKQLKKEQVLMAIKAFAGSIKEYLLFELLAERKQDRAKDGRRYGNYHAAWL